MLGKQYPLLLPDTDGAFIELFTLSEKRVTACFSNITTDEFECFKNGDVSSGVLSDKDQIMLLRRFMLTKREPMVLAGMLDTRLINDLVPLYLNAHHTVSIYVVERTTRKLMALRNVSMPPAYVQELHPSVQKQLEGIEMQGPLPEHQWPSASLDTLAESVKMFNLAEA